MSGAVSGDRAHPRLDRGLCGTCRHGRIVHSARGSNFLLCQRATHEPTRFVKYPRLPVLECAGFEARDADDPGEEQ